MAPLTLPRRRPRAPQFAVAPVELAAPSSGQGVSLAIEDAVVLAKCLRDETRIEVAFATYERMRRERVERVVAEGKKNGDGKTPGPFGRVVRDLMLRLIFRRDSGKVADRMTWIFDHHIGWDGPAPAARLLTRREGRPSRRSETPAGRR